MRPRENYTPFVAVALGLTLAIMVSFQVYIFREPARIAADEARDKSQAVEEGGRLYRLYCNTCHGRQGEGVSGPPLNEKQFLTDTNDQTIFSLVSSGVPGTEMPAWNQSLGGPLTDQQVSQLVTFIRNWEPTAPKLTPVVLEPDPIRGAAIYARTCFVCHGANGGGTDKAPALNDLERLSKLDDAWYRSTIARGRPAKGMPTWGTVLSPAQINDLVALIAAWRGSQAVSPAISLATYLTNALFAIQEFDQTDAQFYLNEALTQVDSVQAEEIRAIIDLIQENRLFEAGTRLSALLPPEEMGQAAFESNCAGCHGSDGSGGTGPNLHNNPYIQSKSDEELVAFLLAGRRGTPMNGFEGILTEETLHNVVVLLRAWQ
jgi:cytochrome c oxidase cbb3-type subunit 3